MRIFAILAILLGLCGTARAVAPEYVEIATDDRPLQAFLYRPDGDGPFPAVVALHGCEGLKKGHGGQIRASLDEWGRRLSAAGFVVLFPDSFSSRGLAGQCHNRTPLVRPDRERIAEVLGNEDRLVLVAAQLAADSSPEVARIGWDDFERIDELIAAGEKAARLAVPQIRGWLAPPK